MRGGRTYCTIQKGLVSISGWLLHSFMFYDGYSTELLYNYKAQQFDLWGEKETLQLFVRAYVRRWLQWLKADKEEDIFMLSALYRHGHKAPRQRQLFAFTPYTVDRSAAAHICGYYGPMDHYIHSLKHRFIHLWYTFQLKTFQTPKLITKFLKNDQQMRWDCDFA